MFKLNMNIQEIIKEEIINYLQEEDYRGNHSAPTTDSSPMHDLSDTYPDDIYSYDAARLYSHYNNWKDNQAISIIQSARNKPKKPIKIYRAVPDLNFDTNSKLKLLYYIVNYYNKFKFFPMKNDIVHNLQDKYDINKYSYDNQKKMILDDLNQQILNLESQQQQKLGINNGDWITIFKEYAKEHGISNLNDKFKIVSKTVPAQHLYTDGNDIFEWSYYVN